MPHTLLYFLLLAFALRLSAEAAPGQNLADSRQGTWVLASSFADYSEHYPDRLIDGREETHWKPSSAALPQWIEVRWPLAVQLDRVQVLSPHPLADDAYSLWYWEGEKWKQALRVPEQPNDAFSFERVTTSRLKMVFESTNGEGLKIAEIRAFGPKQPLPSDLRPGWSASYIWHAEPSKIYQANVSYFFRKSFEIEDPAAVEHAAIQIRSNDYYHLRVNGTSVYQSSKAREGRAIPITRHLVKGRNTIAIETSLNSTPSWGLGLLIAEIHLIDQKGVHRIGTDAHWKSSKKAEPGWAAPDFDDADWTPAVAFFKPPHGPWGEIRYYTHLPKERASLAATSILPSRPRPGDEIELTFELEPQTRLKGDYQFQVEIGDPGLLSGKSDFRLVSALATHALPTRSWKEKARQKITASVTLPTYSPGGELPVYLRAYDRDQGHTLTLERPGVENSAPVARLSMDRPAESQPVGSPEPARIAWQDGAIQVQTGRQSVPPLFWSPQVPTFEKLDAYSRTGIDTFFLSTSNKLGPADWKEQTLPAIDLAVKHLLSINPKAKVLLKVELRPTFDWLHAHPGERLIRADGSAGPQSFASDAYRQLVKDHLRVLLDHIHSQSYADRVIGYMLWAPGRADAGLGGVEGNIWQGDRRKITIGDYHPQAMKAFRDWLGERYQHSDAALAAAWKQPGVTFSTASVAPGELIAEGPGGSLFTDLSRGRAPYDYFEFLTQLLPKFYLEMAGFVKEQSRHRVLVGLHYGYLIDQVRAMHPGSGPQNGNFFLTEMLKSPAIDFYCGSTVYGGARKAGSAFQVRLPWGSINLHGKLYINDGDYRTFLAYPVTYGRQTSERETLSVLRRDLGSSVIRNLGIWFADFSKEEGRTAVGWFMHPSILKTISDFNTLYRQHAATPPRSTTQIAVFLDENSYFTHDFFSSPLLYKNLVEGLVYDQLPQIGAPFDVFTLADLGSPKVHTSYKLFVFLNAFRLSPKDRENLAAIRREGKTSLFLYAPGYLRDGEAPSLAAVSDTVGMTVGSLPVTPGHFTVAEGDPAIGTLAGERTRLQIITGRKEEAMLGKRASQLRPGFQITDASATPLAYWPNGEVAVAEKVSPHHGRAIYSALPYLEANLLRVIARKAGVHLYSDRKVRLDADSHLLMIHHGYEPETTVTLTLPEKKAVYDAMTGEPVAPATTQFEVKLEENQTRLLQLK